MRTQSLRVMVASLGIAGSAFTAISIPVGYALVSHVAEQRALTNIAELSATKASRYVFQYGEMWPYHRIRLTETIALPPAIGSNVRQRAYSGAYTQVTDDGGEVEKPSYVVSAPIMLDGAVVGRVEIEASLQPLLRRAGVAAAIAAAIAFSFYLIFRFLPLRALDRTLQALHGREEELSRTNAQFHAALANMPLGLSMFDAEGRMQLANDRYRLMYGLRPEDVAAGASRQAILEARKNRGTAPNDVAGHEAWISALVERRQAGAIELALTDGRFVKVSTGPGEGGGMVETHEDVTAIHHARARIAHMAHHDALTDLPNRALLRLSAERALSAPGASIAVLALDLDRFKDVNDTFGHPVGDELLIEVSQRLREPLAPDEVVARLGGDEFAIIITGDGAAQRGAALSARIVDRLAEPFVIGGRRITIGVSVGVAVSPEDGADPDTLLKAADIALYRAKNEGRGRCRFFKAEMDADVQERRRLEGDLREALVNGQLQLHYQPLVNLATNRVTAVEALMRWTHPTRGSVSPGVFIPLAEEIGLIGRMGAWALQQACEDVSEWPEDVRVCVNVSPMQFKSDTLVMDVAYALGSADISARRLELEVTESALLNDTQATLDKLAMLRQLGVHVAMDDFGTGYSSLSYLRRFAFDRIKIDQFFVRDLTVNPDAQAIVRAIIGLGRSLGIAVTAEGVETVEQLDYLRQEGCTDVQGWLFSKARPKEEVPAMLRTLSAPRQAA